MSFLFEGQLAYVTSAYVITGCVFSCLILWTLIDRKKQRTTLANLEAHGASRAADKKADQ